MTQWVMVTYCLTACTQMIPFQKQFRIWYLTSFQLQMPIKKLEYSDKWNDYFFLQV